MPDEAETWMTEDGVEVEMVSQDEGTAIVRPVAGGDQFLVVKAHLIRQDGEG